MAISAEKIDEQIAENVYWWRPLEDTGADTRSVLLAAAYREIHQQGFQSASLSRILAHTGVTKGALYHHFPNKLELGYAVVEEVIARRIQLSFIEPLYHFDHPIDGMIQLIEQAGESFSMTDIELGCPLTVLAQEMAPIDEGFRQRLTRIYDEWHQSLADVMSNASEQGLIKADIDPEVLAATIAAAMEGSLNAAKVSQDLGKLHQVGCGLIHFLQLIKK